MMHTTCLNSSISLRCKASRSSYTDHPNYFFDARFVTSPQLISSSISNCCCCCCCCANNNSNLIYNTLPRINPSFSYNGLRQSTLIQFSPSKRLINHGRRRKYCNITDSDRNYYYEKLYSFKEMRKLGKGRYACSSYEDKKKDQFVSNEIDDDYVNDVEILLDLLTEEVGLENIGVRKQKNIKKNSGYITGKTKSVNSESVKKDLKCHKKIVEIQSRKEEKEDRGIFVKKVNHERKKEGSSCSSYYSVSSSKGEYDSDNDVEIKHDERFFKGETSSEYKDDQKIDNYMRNYDEETEENVDKQQEFCKEEHGILKKNTSETYYGNQEWRKKSEKKLNVDSSQSQSQVSLITEQNSQQKADRITNQSQSMKYKRFTEKLETDTNVVESSTNIQKRYSDTENKLIIDRKQNVDRVTHEDEDRREEEHLIVDQLTTLKDSKLKSQQFSEISNTRITSTESNMRREKQELNLETSSSSETVTIDQPVDLRRKTTEDKYLESGPTKLVKTGRKTTKALSFNVGMPNQETVPYKALRLNPEPNLQETGTQIIHENVIDSADEQQKSSSSYVDEFVKKAKHELSVSEIGSGSYEVKSSGESGSGNFDQKDGPSDEMWHETGSSSQQPVDAEIDAEIGATDLTEKGESVKRSGRSLWNVIGDVVRLKWVSQRAEKSSSNQSTSSERWFSGHDSNDENVKTGSKKDQKEYSKLDSSSSSSSKSQKVKVIEESSVTSPAIRMRRSPASGETGQLDPNPLTQVPLPAIRMRRSPIVKPGKTDASTSGETGQLDPNGPNPLTEVPQTDRGKMVIVDQPIRKLARIDQFSKDRFDEWEEAYNFEAKTRETDEYFMKEALLEAKKAADFWEVPVGAVLVQDGKVIARGYNLVEESRDSTAHAEMICIREASNNLRSWRLSGTTLYVTLEPCPMCAGAILQARIDTVVWGAPNKLLGADGSWIRLFPDGDGGNGSDKPPAPVHPFHPNMVVRRGVLSSECANVMQQFFQLRRKKKDKKTETEPPTPPPPSCLPIAHHHNSKFLSKMHDAFSIMFCL